MTPLQTLILNRLAELDESYRDAAAKTGGLLSFSYLQQIATGAKKGNLTGKTVLGISLALEVPKSRVEKAVEESRGAVTEFRLPKKADKLTPKQRKAVMAYVDALLELHGTAPE